MINTTASIWCENMLGYLTTDVIFSLKITVRFSKQIMSTDEYASIFRRKMEAIVYLYKKLGQIQKKKKKK